MTKQIALFNHKGGVSKTTTTFNLGWMLANKGKKVVIVDCDPQCNLTRMVLGLRGTEFEIDEAFDAIYESEEVRNIHQGLAPAFESRPVLLEPVICEPVKGQPNMYLLPGNIKFAEYEVVLGMAQELSGSLPSLQNLPGSLNYLFMKTAKQYEADFVLVDMGPSLGAINRNLLMTSDYFLVPMFPDYFSVMAADSLASILSQWAAWSKQGRALPILREATYPFPDKIPKFLGTIIQNYRVRSEKPAATFKNWIEAIEEAVKTKLVPVLKKNNMLLPYELYEQVMETKPDQSVLCPEDQYSGILGKPLLQMPDFNSLIALSQKHRVPVFDLTDAQFGYGGVVLEQAKEPMFRFEKLYSDGADRIITLTSQNV